FADQANSCRSRAHAPAAFFGDGNSTAQLVELGLVGLARDFYDVRLRYVRRRFHQRVGQRAVVGHQQKAFASPVQAAHGIHASLHLLTRSITVGRFFSSLTVVTYPLGLLSTT